MVGLWQEVSLSGLQMAPFSLCPHMAERGSPLVSLLIKIPILLDQRPIPMTSFNLYCFLRGLISKYSHVVGLQDRDFKETQTLSLQNPPNWRFSVFLRLSTTCTCKQLSQLKDALFPWKKSTTSDNNQRRSISGRNVFPWEGKAKTKSHGREDWALN